VETGLHQGGERTHLSGVDRDKSGEGGGNSLGT
jgi:hypothetical protein